MRNRIKTFDFGFKDEETYGELERSLKNIAESSEFNDFTWQFTFKNGIKASLLELNSKERRDADYRGHLEKTLESHGAYLTIELSGQYRLDGFFVPRYIGKVISKFGGKK